MTSLPVVLRPYRPSDEACVFKSWLETFRKGSRCHRHPEGWYYPRQRRLISGLLDGGATVVCAAFSGDPDEILGWACYDLRETLPIVHYVYVKHAFRGLGIAKQLLGELLQRQCVFTHRTRWVKPPKQWIEDAGVIA
jgi:GNAT superfamily N-acetyltransferase